MTKSALNEAIAQAAQLIRRRGWTQDCGEDRQGRMCMVHAIVTVINTSSAPGQAGICQDACKHLRGFIGGKDPINWNDHPGRTLDEVLGLLDKAANTPSEPTMD